MVSFSGQQKAEVLILISDTKTLVTELRDECFEMSSDTEKMFRFELAGNIYGIPPKAELKPFKPRNAQLVADSTFWLGFLEYQVENKFSTASLIDISNTDYQNIISGLNQLLGWIDMVNGSYFEKRLPCYHNVTYTYKDPFTGEPVLPGQELLNYQRLILFKNTLILEPTPDLTENSILCKEADIDNFNIKVQIYFRLQPYIDKLEIIKQKMENLLGILQLPTPTQAQPITPVQIDSTGTRRLLQTILDFQTSVFTTFQKLLGISKSIYGHASFILLFLREDTKIDLQTIIENTKDIIGGDPDEIGVTSLNQIRYIWLQGSEGNYYPQPPIESTDPLNDIEISTTNGILAGLRRADFNGRWRYRRINDALFEIATNNNINKAFLEDLSPRIQTIETKVLEIQTKQLELEIKINEILTKVNTL